MSTTERKSPPSDYQKNLLKGAGVRRKPRTWESAKKLVDQLPPSEGQAALLREIGMEVPESRAEATRILTAYEEAHPHWAAARKAEKIRRGLETRRRTQAAKAAAGAPSFADQQIRTYHEAAARRHGEQAACEKTLRRLRSTAYQLPRDSQERISAFTAMKGGVSQTAASTRIREIDQSLPR